MPSWKFLAAEVLKLLHLESPGDLDGLRRLAVPLLFYAHQAKQRGSREALSALLCIRLWAQEMRHSVMESLESGETGLTAPGGELQDLALALAHWVSPEWCSPRIEVVDFLPCCQDASGLFLSETCDHSKLRTVLDVVLCAPMPDGQEIGRQRLLHHGCWQGFQPVPGGWHTSYPAGSALHRWEEVTAAGLLVLAASRSNSQPAILVYGACDGLLASFLAQHAPEVQVDLHEVQVETPGSIGRVAADGPNPGSNGQNPGSTASDAESKGRNPQSKGQTPEFAAGSGANCVLDLLQHHFDLKLGGPGRLKNSRRVLPTPELPGEPDTPGLYDGIVVMKPFGSSKLPDVSEALRALRPGGLLLVEAATSHDLEVFGDVLELNDLLQDDEIEEDDTVLCIVTPSESSTARRVPELPKSPANFEELIRPETWFELLLERGGVLGGAPDVLEAQKTRVVPAGQLLPADLRRLEHLAQRGGVAGCGVEVRSRDSESWQVTFLQTNNFFEVEAPDLLKRFADIARSVALQEKWLTPAQADRLQARVVEWHQQESPGPGIPDPRHYDMDSLITVDVMCSAPGKDFQGGQLQTLEPDGRLLEHRFQLYDILVFQAHKYHCVAPVVHGCRRALVLEFWDGPARVCPHRCISFERNCPLENRPVEAASKKAPGRLLPFRLAAKKCETRETKSPSDASPPKSVRCMRLLWQCNEPTQ